MRFLLALRGSRSPSATSPARRFFLLLLLVLAVLLPAEAQSPSANDGHLADQILDARAGNVPLRAWMSPSPAQVGLAHLSVEVGGGATARGISVVMDMPSMPAMHAVTTTLQSSGHGRWEGDPEFSMAGAWRLRIVVATDAGVQEAVAPMLTVGGGRRPAAAPSTPPAAETAASVEVTCLPVPPKVGENPLRIRLPGAPPEGTRVWVGVDMPGMPMGVAPREAHPQPDGTWGVSVPLAMSGLWHVTVDAGPYQGATSLTVPVPGSTRPGRPLLVALAALALPLGLWLAVRGRPLALFTASVALLASTFLAGTFIERYWPPDDPMGMAMDMTAPDMGMAGMTAPLPVLEAMVQRLPMTLARTCMGRVLAGREVVLVSPARATLLTRVEVGQRVRKGEVVAHVGAEALRSPLDGVVTRTEAALGDRLSTADPVLTVGEVATVRVRARAPMADMEAVTTGARVDVVAGERTGTGIVARLSAVADGGIFEFDARVDNVAASSGGMGGGSPQKPTDAPMGVFTLGQEVEVRYVVDTRPPVLSVPRDAVRQDEDRRAVFVVERRAGQRIAHRVDVTTGLGTETHTEIVSGLQEGQQVVAAADPGLRDGMVVTPGTWGSGAWRSLLLPREDAMHAP